jgi:lipid-A-disaccharide synthase
MAGATTGGNMSDDGQATHPDGRGAARVFVIAGENSGDALGAKLMAALSAICDRPPTFAGVGGHLMEEKGLKSLFPLSEVAVMGPLAILTQLPALIRRVYQTVDAAIAADPGVVVIIDSPEFTHPIARRIRRRRPDIPILDYVSPSVWAWRPGRARRMRPYVDHVLALLPFEPDEHARLGGPPCTYVGHPLIEQLPWLEKLDPAPLAARLGLVAARPTLVVLPGSRRSEISRLMPVFGETVAKAASRCGPLEVVLPVAASARPLVEAGLAGWSVAPHLVEGHEDKFRAFKLAHGALAASGTVTLELALAGTPMVVAYKVEPLSAPILRLLISAQSIVLPNLILGENAIPEFIQEKCTSDALADALVPLLSDTAERRRQKAALAGLPSRMAFAEETPSRAAARVVVDYLNRKMDTLT